MATCPLFEAPFYFLRHGETETNRLGLTTGMTDVALNATGERQARAAAAALVGLGIDAIYASPLQRSLGTARCVAEVLNVPIVTLSEIAERNWGVHEGKPRTARNRAATPEGGESLRDFTVRTLTGLGRIPRAGVPLVIAHSGTFRVICEHLGIAATTQVGNCRPVRFTPPSGPGRAWAAGSL